MPRARRLPAIAAALLACAAAAPAWAADTARGDELAVYFDDSWSELNFSIFSSNDYGLEGRRLTVASDETVSMLWRALPARFAAAKAAQWDWAVTRSTPATDLTRKGGDDRNLALYFVFLPESQAAEARKASMLALLEEENARVLVYTWGGAYAPGDVVRSPYLGERGRIVALQAAGTGAASEQADLAADHQRAFGEPAGVLVGLAVSADGDDTDSVIEGEIARLVLR